jgi:type 1 glutamine amidotransferase
MKHKTSRLSSFGFRASFVIWHLAFVILLAGVARAAEPLRALLITGGCCHDYEGQKTILTEGITARANVTWTIVHEGGADSKDTKFSIYEKPDWTKGFDVVVHNECSGMVTNVEWVEHIAKGHFDGVPAVVIHCSIHSYRNSTTDEWRKLLGVSSYRHQPRRKFTVVTLKPEHPIMKGFPAKWDYDPDELYEIKKVWPDCVALAQSLTPKNETDTHPSIWVNTYGKARVFGTTLGHGNETMRRDVYLDLITRGLLWACDKLDADGKPKAGYAAK